MAKAEWGSKRICPHCGARYYDMKKRPPVCPSCGTAFDPEALMKTRRGRVTAEEKARKAAPVPEVIEDIPIVDGDEPEDAVIEDADELADDVDVEEVVEVEGSDDEN
ncbi:MAG: TIGR02300 family protein [Alphaproteobacteria bacterium]|nr:TIGR02300 family protein [Alphaproteobacteria bacterium]